MPSELDRYEERYRLTGGAVLGLAASLLSIGLGLLWHTPVIFAALAVILAVLTVTLPGAGVIDAARRMTAFRADHAGLTLGAVPGLQLGDRVLVQDPRVAAQGGDREWVVEVILAGGEGVHQAAGTGTELGHRSLAVESDCLAGHPQVRASGHE